MENTIREQLFALAEPEYRAFTSKLIPTNTNIIGISIPKLRNLAKQIAKEDWQTYLMSAQSEYMEEIMLQGMVIGLVNIEIEEKLKLIQDFIPKIDNWSVCDSLCSGLKMTKKHPERFWEFIQPYFSSKNEYEVRFGIVMLLNYFVTENYIEKILPILNNITHQGYYVKMANAWAISICYIKYPDITLHFLHNNNLDKFTHNKALQKITESLRIDKETKSKIRQLKR